MDLEPGDRLLILCAKESLDALLSEDTESPGSFQRKFHLSNALAIPIQFRSLTNPRPPCAPGTMRIGADDGPQTIYNAADGTMTHSAITGVDILGQAAVRIASDGNVVIQDRFVDPIGGGDI
jgi:hypothetical protein